jgi:hypothetical protein
LNMNWIFTLVSLRIMKITRRTIRLSFRFKLFITLDVGFSYFSSCFCGCMEAHNLVINSFLL